jgi:hydroxymethylbilane synthase
LQEITFAQVGAVTGSKGIFTKEIEEALAEGRVDLAVHSLKDLPTELPPGFALAATPPRVDARDVFVSVKYGSIAELPAGATVGTSSARRRAQLSSYRKDLQLVEFRGNVDTRLRKLGEGQVDGILLAAAGLDRLEKTEWVRERIAPEVICPATGQGSLGIEIRLEFLNDGPTRFAITAERTALNALGGGCQTPIGAHCRAIAGALAGGSEIVYEILGVVAAPDGSRIIKARQTGTDAVAIGQALAAELIAGGAGELLELPA